MKRRSEAGAVPLKTVGVVVGVVLTVLMVASVFFNFHAHAPFLTPRFTMRNFFSQLPSHMRWLIPFAVLSYLMLPLRALQWQTTLQKKVPFKERYHSVAIGAFVHNALPGKLGDVFRAFLVARSQNIPFVESLGSVAVCKLLEFAALMLLVAASFFGPFRKTMEQFSGGLKVALAVCVAAFAVVLILAHYAEKMIAALEKRQKLPKVQKFLTNVGQGLGTARSLRGLTVALFFSIGPVLAPAVGYGMGLGGLGIHGGVFAGAVMLGAIALGQSAPGVPVGMGVYYFMTSWAARQLGASEEAAAAYSVLTHLATVFTQVLAGLISMWIRKFKWSDLKARSNAAKGAAIEAAHEGHHAVAEA